MLKLVVSVCSSWAIGLVNWCRSAPGFAVSGLEQAILSPGQNSGNYFAPIPLEDHSENKVDILEMLQKAKVDLKPLLSSLSANKEKLRESSKCLFSYCQVLVMQCPPARGLVFWKPHLPKCRSRQCYRFAYSTENSVFSSSQLCQYHHWLFSS